MRVHRFSTEAQNMVKRIENEESKVRAPLYTACVYNIVGGNTEKNEEKTEGPIGAADRDLSSGRPPTARHLRYNTVDSSAHGRLVFLGWESKGIQ